MAATASSSTGSPSAGPVAQEGGAPAPTNAALGGNAGNVGYILPATMQENQPMANSGSLYVGDLNSDVTESLLFDLFNAVGPVMSIRVCRDATTRRSLGYAYVNFQSQGDAERALDTMNFTLIKGTPCRIMWSQRDPSLRKTGAGNVFCKNLDPSIDNKALYDTFSLFGDILSCKVVTGRDGQSKGYGFVHFETTEAAEEAIARINGMLIAGREVYVGRFVKRAERPGATEWTNVFVKNIPLHWDRLRLQDEFSACGMIASAVIMEDDQGQSRGFGFVDFVEHEGATKAVATMNEKVVLTKLGEETGPEESEGEEDEEEEGAESPQPDQEAEEYYVENKDGSSPDEKMEKNADGTEKKKRKPKKTAILYVSRAQKKIERERELAQKHEQRKIDRSSKYAGINCFVKNLHEDVDDELLRKEFAPFGVITSARVMREQQGEKQATTPSSATDSSVNSAAGESATQIEVAESSEKKEDANPADQQSVASNATSKNLNPSKGFGFVCFTAPEEATRAVTEMNGKMILGKPIYVALAQRKDARRAQLEATHQQRMPRGMQMQPPMYGGAPVYYGGMHSMGNPVGGMGGRGGMGNIAYFQQSMMAGGMGNGPGMGGPRGSMGMGGVPRGGLGAPMGYGRSQGNFPMGPSSMMFNGAQNPMGMGGGPQSPSMAGRGRRQARPGGRQSRVPGPPIGVPNMPMMMPNKYISQPGQVPQQPRPDAAAQNASPSEPLTAAALANAPEEQRKNIIGERLFPLVQLIQPTLAGKITGMLLEMDHPEVLLLLESPDALNDKITEALNVLEKHQASGSEEGAAADAE